MRKFTHNGIKAIEMSIKKINLAEQSVIFFHLLEVIPVYLSPNQWKILVLTKKIKNSILM